VIIQADRAVPTGLTVKVYDEAKLGGAQAVHVATTAAD
jgi:biopolymer transport protein ExbD